MSTDILGSGARIPFTLANFLALTSEESRLDTARVVLVPVPYDGTTSYRSGARGGPQAILRASRELEEYDVELQWEPCAVGIHTAAEMEPHVAGPQWMVDRVQAAVGGYLDREKVVGLLGGEHSLTVGAVRAAAERFPNISVLYLDAHADFRDAYQGSAYSHACAARRVQEVCPLVLAGVRSVSSEERLAIARLGVPVFYRGPDALDEVCYTQVLQHLSDYVYISVDLDVLDPSFMAAVGNPEPGGLGWWELLGLLRMVGQRHTIIGFDVTELTPGEGPEACAYTAAKLVYKMIGYTFWGRR